jgi:hypothetical protein
MREVEQTIIHHFHRVEHRRDVNIPQIPKHRITWSGFSPT